MRIIHRTRTGVSSIGRGASRVAATTLLALLAVSMLGSTTHAHPVGGSSEARDLSSAPLALTAYGKHPELNGRRLQFERAAAPIRVEAGEQLDHSREINVTTSASR